MTSPGETRKLLQVIGQQRSGNHAIINWISSLFPVATHENDLPHDFFAQPESVARAAAASGDCATFSFEDARGRFREKEMSFLESVVRLDPDSFPGWTPHVLHILRDPYNCWASRVRAREGGRLSSSSQLEPFVRDWTALARLALDRPDAVILYNFWFRDEAYRRKICTRLGGTYSEATLGEVRGEGGGSSFDGFVRPSYRSIVTNPGRYLSADFRKRFMKAPSAYITRLFSPPIDGRQLEVDARWRHVVGHANSQALFENAEVAGLSDALFGFHVSPAGQLVTAPGWTQEAGEVLRAS
jgi:hypothetical protein